LLDLPLSYYLVFTLALYVIGIYCLATKRNLIRLLLGIEILVNAANINFIVFAAYAMPDYVDSAGHSFAAISIGLAGAVSAVALATVVLIYRHYGTLDSDELKQLRG
jgi:NADH:ubiquinone oxidoreductase subunit K